MSFHNTHPSSFYVLTVKRNMNMNIEISLIREAIHALAVHLEALKSRMDYADKKMGFVLSWINTHTPEPEEPDEDTEQFD